MKRRFFSFMGPCFAFPQSCDVEGLFFSEIREAGVSGIRLLP